MQKFTAAPEAQGFVRQRYDGESYRGGYSYQQQPAQEPQQPVSGFSSGSPTTRFQAPGHAAQPASFGSMMAGSATGMYAPASGATGRYAAAQQ